MKHTKEQKDFLLQFGNKVHEYRTKKKLSFRALSQQCDIDFADLNRIEKGKRNITLLTALELSRGLGIQPKDLFDFEIPEDTKDEKSTDK